MLGNNGIIIKAQIAKEKTEETQKLEEEKLEKLEENMDSEMQDNLGISSKDILKSENKSEYYGAIVTGYECPNSAAIENWKIFYADENHIYLIADDYIHYTYCPRSETQMIYTNTEYALSFNNVITDYKKGLEDITDPKIRELNSKYFEKNISNEGNAIKSVAYMLDTKIWSNYKGEIAEYAIGGPTIEMFINSYNQRYNTKYQTAVNEQGYLISVDEGNSWGTTYKGIFNTNDGLYIVNSNRAVAMWLASPCSGSYDSISIVWNDKGTGWIDGNYYYWYADGLRPIVCLKSNTKLEKIEDGVYEIKD